VGDLPGGVPDARSHLQGHPDPAAHPDGMNLEVRHNGAVVAAPHVVEVVLVGRGRRDIPRAASGQGAPIELALAVPVVELLVTQTRDRRSALPTPPVADATGLRIGPALIGRRQQVRVTVPTDADPHLCGPRLDVRVRKIDLVPAETPTYVVIERLGGRPPASACRLRAT
jgi:hypothetical protein